MDKWTGRVALVTGASRGIGSSVARMLCQQGMVVVALARDIAELEAIAVDYKTNGFEGSLVPIKCDITQPDRISALLNTIRTDPDLEGVDVLINNAAVAFAEPLLSGNPDVWATMVKTNFLGPTILAQEVFKSMKEREVDDGHIIFVNSLSGHRLLPGNKDLHMYSATKFALRSIVEGLRLELRQLDSHIRVSSISPGVVETDIFKKLFDNDEEKTKKFLSERKYLTADDVANLILSIMSQPGHVQIHDLLVRSTEQIP
ncbi:dehydrogenase/reductase SDR family member 11-like isoform X1 [Biomphalaria pfeifferi]|uniref:Dehydrogenase/reductase SDR family member 11-like isoform X1 n=1 Tax=Biomphalaria pfeifferi TaxID=112525 RepID=A0AAD8FCP7_BIOPF|nr:dehydrogenase/reductase SDR family member 11-like isoform X1 [Biomphalaria pfeifferi]